MSIVDMSSFQQSPNNFIVENYILIMFLCLPANVI